MFIKPRTVSAELKLLRYLNLRISFSVEETQYYLNLEKGFDGELYFDELLGKLSGDWLVISDLLIEVNNTIFQIDSLLIYQKEFTFLTSKIMKATTISMGTGGTHHLGRK